MYGRVVGVTDRDSLKILVAEQQLLRVRIAICDASEKRQPFGTRAKQARCMSFEFFGFFTFGPLFCHRGGLHYIREERGKRNSSGFVGGRKEINRFPRALLASIGEGVRGWTGQTGEAFSRARSDGSAGFAARFTDQPDKPRFVPARASGLRSLF
jgi:hypothetical protein